MKRLLAVPLARYDYYRYYDGKERMPPKSSKPDFRICRNANCNTAVTIQAGGYMFRAIMVMRTMCDANPFMTTARTKMMPKGFLVHQSQPTEAVRTPIVMLSTNYQRWWSFLLGYRGGEDYTRCDSYMNYWRAHNGGADRIPKLGL